MGAVGTAHIAPPDCQALRTVPTALHGFVKTRGEGSLFDKRKLSQTHRHAVTPADHVGCDQNVKGLVRSSCDSSFRHHRAVITKDGIGVAAVRPWISSGADCVSVRESYCLAPIARRSKLCVIVWARSSGPWGRDQCDQGSVWPGGEDNACAQKIVDALNTKFPLGPG
jgi:hypothetical protein